jgi:hypothetical protein
MTRTPKRRTPRPTPPLRAVLERAALEERDPLVRAWLKALADKGEFIDVSGSGRPSSDIPVSRIPDHPTEENTTKHRPRLPETEP